MWKGITVKQGGTLEMNTMTSIKDAQYAVSAQKGSTVKATDCMFFNNNYGVITAPEGVGNYNCTLMGNQFGTDDAGLKTPYSANLPHHTRDEAMQGFTWMGQVVLPFKVQLVVQTVGSSSSTTAS